MGMMYSEPVCQAAYDDDVHGVYHLLRDDAKNLNAQDARYGDTPIIAACRRGNVRVVRYLLENKADVSLRNKKQRTCLHYAARKTFSFLDYLMIAILMPILLLGYLIMEERQRKNMSLLTLVLGSSVEVDAIDNKGNTALHYACLRKSDRLVPLLLEKNADISIKNQSDESALDIAKRMQFKKIVSMLKKSD